MTRGVTFPFCKSVLDLLPGRRRRVVHTQRSAHGQSHALIRAQFSRPFLALPREPRAWPLFPTSFPSSWLEQAGGPLLLHVFTSSPPPLRSTGLPSARRASSSLPQSTHPRMPRGDGYVGKVGYKLACVVQPHFKGKKNTNRVLETITINIVKSDGNMVIYFLSAYLWSLMF